MDRTPRTNETEAQAAQWLIRLEANSSASTRAQWRHWLSQDMRRRVAYLRLENVWRQTDCLKRLRPPDGTVDLDVLNRFPGLDSAPRASRVPRHRAVAPWAITAAATLTAVLVWAWLSVAEP